MSHQQRNSVSVYRFVGASAIRTAASAGAACAGPGATGTATTAQYNLELQCTIDNASSGTFEQLDFSRYSGWVAFLEVVGEAPLLLVSDSIKGVVHLFDVRSGQHVGYLVAPGDGSLPGARGVAVSPDARTIAVSAYGPDDRVTIRLYSAQGTRELLRTIDGGAGRARSVAFSADGLVVAVLDNSFCRVLGYSTVTYEPAGHIVGGLDDPRDLKEYRGGWLIPSFHSNRITWVGPDGHIQSVLDPEVAPAFKEPLAVAVLGPDPTSEMLVVRCKSGVCVFRLRVVPAVH